MLIYSAKINVSGSDVDNNNEGITCVSDDAGDYIIQLFNGYMLSNSKEDFLKFIYEKK